MLTDAQRLPALISALVTMQRRGLPLIACCNADTTGLVTPPGMDLPTPSIEHSIVACSVCTEDIWIGPRQKLVIGIRMCFRCYCVALDHGLMDTPVIVSLNPDEGQIPRRT